MLIEHVGITVRDLERSRVFYEAILGEPPLQRVSWRDKDAEYVARMMGQPGLTLDVVFFRIGREAILEVIQFHGLPETGESKPVRHYEVGGVHLGFCVKNIEEVFDRLRAAGVGVLNEPKPVAIEYGPYKGTGGRSVIFRDPDENNLQLMEITSRPGGLPLPAGVGVE